MSSSPQTSPARDRRASTGNLLDGFAVCASAACMVHCLGLPLLLAVLPAIAHRLDPGEHFHLAVLLLAVPTSAFALVGGWRRHRGFVPLAVGAIGLTLMALGLALAHREAIETALTVAGSLLLAGAHVANWRGRSGGARCESRC
ncbi:MerC domain-containing protein [Novosphingobium resinovorum]|nr:MerC domain-containing protein [Novosphingobium resinovorum]